MRQPPGSWRCVAAMAVAAAVLWSPAPARAQRVNVTRYSTADGLPAARVAALYQDSAGYLWFGTSGGVARYDGTEFTVMAEPGEPGRGAVVDLVEDPVRGLLVALRDGGLYLVHDGELQALPGAGLSGTTIRHLTRDDQGTIWIATSDGALRLDPGTTPVALDSGGLTDCCRAVLCDRRGRVWAGTDSGLARLQGGRLVRVDVGLPAGVGVTVLMEDATGALWTGTDAGLYRESAGRFLPVDTPLGADVRVLSAMSGPLGSIWIGTERGAIRYAADVDRIITTANGLPDDRINDLLVDREGTVWFATDSGAAKLVGSNFATLTSSHGLADDFVVGTLWHRSRLWVATRDGLAWMHPDGLPQRVELPGLDTASVTAIGAGAGDVLVGTSRGSVYRVGPDGRGARLVARPLESTITAILELGGQLWIGTESGPLVGDVAHGFRTPEEPPELTRVQVTDLAVDRQGGLWVGTADGLFRRRQQDLERPPGGPAAGVAVWDVAPDPRSGVWVATNGTGVLRVTDSEILRLTRQGNGLASDFVQQLVPDQDGRLWIYTNRGLDHWDPEVGVTHYDVGSGLADMSGNPAAGATDLEGHVWLGTPSGLTVYRPGPETVHGVRPPVVIRDVLVDGRRVDRPGPVTISYGRNELVFKYTALSYRDEAGTRFQYRLRGHRDEWSRLTDQRQVAYAGLPPGEYVFEVNAISAGGMWSEAPASRQVIVAPAFWQTRWFQLSTIAVVVAAVGMLFRERLRRVDDERQRLRDMVNRRTRELVEKNTLLERMATTDELTGLPNRRFFLESMERELRKLSRLPIDQPLSLLVLDLDHFKSINDRYGHAAGDAVLVHVSRRLSQGVRATDLPARYGGEEFAILLPNTDLEGARYLAEKLRSDVESMEVVYEGRRMQVTISVGLATVAAASRYAPELEEELLRRADEAMYRAKAGGRNKVVADGDPAFQEGSSEPS